MLPADPRDRGVNELTSPSARATPEASSPGAHPLPRLQLAGPHLQTGGEAVLPRPGPKGSALGVQWPGTGEHAPVGKTGAHLAA